MDKYELRWAAGSDFNGKLDHWRIFHEALQGSQAGPWNRWRRQNRRVRPNLRGVTLSGHYLSDFDLREAALNRADLRRADLSGAKLQSTGLVGADLSGANLAAAQGAKADFRGAQLEHAKMCDGDFQGARFSSFKGDKTNLEGADLSNSNLKNCSLNGANLAGANLTAANLDGANLRGANIDQAVLFGTSARGTIFSGARAKYVFVRSIRTDESTRQDDLEAQFDLWTRGRDWIRGQQVLVNDLRVASFMADLRSYGSAAHLMQAGSTSVVLLLGRFARGHLAKLRLLESELARLGRAPMVFDFPSPEQRELSDVVLLIAGLSRFVMADLTNPSSIPLELQTIVPHAMVPFVPLIKKGKRPFAMFDDLRRKYFWVMPPLVYSSIEEVADQLEDHVFPAVKEMESTIESHRANASVDPLPLGKWPGSPSE